MARQSIADLAPNQRVKSTFVVREKSLRDFSSKPGHFLSLTLADRTGELTAVMWDNADEGAALAEVGAVILVTGRSEDYKGRLQLKIDSLRACTAEEYDMADFVATGRKDRSAQADELLAAIGAVENTHLRALLNGFFLEDAFLQRFADAPASKALHHAYLGGLLEHTLSVLRILQAVLEVHPELDHDVLIAGAILHDLGKIDELGLVGATIDYTDLGRLVGHIVLTDRMVTAKIEEIGGLPDELQARLTHLLLSHHGQKEYGAPVLPMTPEACALHYADNLDAHVQYFKEVVEKGAQGNHWSEYQRLFDRYIYLGPPPSD